VCDSQGQPLRGWKIDEPAPIRDDQLQARVQWNNSDSANVWVKRPHSGYA